jgi:hypothetical protein
MCPYAVLPCSITAVVTRSPAGARLKQRNPMQRDPLKYTPTIIGLSCRDLDVLLYEVLCSTADYTT